MVAEGLAPCSRLAVHGFDVVAFRALIVVVVDCLLL